MNHLIHNIEEVYFYISNSTKGLPMEQVFQGEGENDWDEPAPSYIKYSGYSEGKLKAQESKVPRESCTPFIQWAVDFLDFAKDNVRYHRMMIYIERASSYVLYIHIGDK
jgi:hypothetical protein